MWQAASDREKKMDRDRLSIVVGASLEEPDKAIERELQQHLL
jgi:hypothetical protein